MVVCQVSVSRDGDVLGVGSSLLVVFSLSSDRRRGWYLVLGTWSPNFDSILTWTLEIYSLGWFEGTFG